MPTQVPCAPLPEAGNVADGAREGDAPAWHDGRRGRIDPKELRRRQEAFITKEAGLTPAEAAYFFPSFRELKQKQRTIRRAIRQKSRRVRKEKLAEKDCDKLLKEIDSLVRQDTNLELAYHARWRKKLSASKIILILAADRRFSKYVFDGHVK